MPEITLLGWFHTAIGSSALISGGYALARFKEISPGKRSGQIYLIATLITAVSALGIFQHGGFGAAHGLAVLTLVALVIGTLAATTGLFGKLSRYIQAASYSATLLFHSIPAVTDSRGHRYPRSPSGTAEDGEGTGVSPFQSRPQPYRVALV